MEDKWHTPSGDNNSSPFFREFRQESRPLTGEKGMWAILDTVARIPSQPDAHAAAELEAPVQPGFAPEPTPLQQHPDPYDLPADPYGMGAGMGMPPPPPPPPEPAQHEPAPFGFLRAQPAPAEAPREPRLFAVPVLTTPTNDSDFSRLFRRQADADPAAAAGRPTSLKDVFKRIS